MRYRPNPIAAVSWSVSTRRRNRQLSRRFQPPKTQYTRIGEVSIAYQVLGDGPIDLIYVPGWLSHLDFQWGGPVFAPFLRRLAEFSRLIMFDKRGVGLSDPVGAAPTLEERMDDVRAVMDAVGSERAALFGTSEGAPIASLFAATYPERVRALTLYGAFAAGPAVASIPGGAGLRDALARARVPADTAWGEGHTLEIFAPSLAGSRTWRRVWGMSAHR